MLREMYRERGLALREQTREKAFICSFIEMQNKREGGTLDFQKAIYHRMAT